MSHEPQNRAVENPLALVLTGDRTEAVAWEEALQRYYRVGLQRLADEPPTDSAEALGALADCAEVEFAGYNGENTPTPARGTLTDEV